MGVALSNSGNFFEEKTINKFNGSKTIIKDGKEEISLYMPKIDKSIFKINHKTSDSFCNYTAYKIKDFLLNNYLDIPLTFAHINKEGLGELRTYNFNFS